MRRPLFAFLAAGLLCGLFLAVNGAAATLLGAIRIDLTQDRLTTLSAASVRVLDRIEQPVVLEYHVAREAVAAEPAARAFADRIRQLLRSYAARSRGRVRLVELDVAPFSAAEDEALAAGFVPLRPEADGGGDGEPGGDGPEEPPLYLGLVARNDVDERVVIPAFDPARADRLEYDITRAIATVSGQPRGRVALVTSLPWLVGPGDGSGIPAASVFRDLADLADVTVVPPDFDVLPPGTGLLVLVQPAPLSLWQQYLIDQHVLREGRVIVALDPASSMAVTAGGEPSGTGHLGGLATAWGIAVSADVVMDRARALAVRVAGGGRMLDLPQPLVFQVPPSAMSPDHPVTRGLARGVHLATSGVVDAAGGAATGATVLMRSSADTMRIDARRALAAPDPRELLGSWESSGQSVPLALALTRPLVSAFAAGPPAAPDRTAERLELFGPLPPPPPRLVRSTAPARIVVFGDVDFLADPYFRTGTGEVADNAALFLTAVEVLGGGSGLADLRGRAARDRRLVAVEAIRQQAGARLAEEDLRLRTRIETARARLAGLEARGAAGAAGTAPDRAAASEIEAVRAELLAARQRLRAVQDAARRGTAAIRSTLLLVCAGLVPAAVLLAGVVLAGRGRGRRSVLAGERA